MCHPASLLSSFECVYASNRVGMVATFKKDVLVASKINTTRGTFLNKT